MATIPKEYMVEYNFDTDEGFFETPEEYEKRVMVNIPPAHPFLKKIGVTQKIYDKISEMYKLQNTAIEKNISKYGKKWWKKGNGTDTFTDGHDANLERAFDAMAQDVPRARPKGISKADSRTNIGKLLHVIFLVMFDDDAYMKDYIEYDDGNNNLYSQSMDRSCWGIVILVNETDNVTDYPINSFIILYLLFFQYGYISMMTKFFNTKTIQIQCTSILFKLTSMYSNISKKKQLMNTIVGIVNDDNNSLDKDILWEQWHMGFLNPFIGAFCTNWITYSSNEVIELFYYNIFKEGISFLFIVSAVLLIENQIAVFDFEKDKFGDGTALEDIFQAMITVPFAKEWEYNDNLVEKGRPRRGVATLQQMEKAVHFCERLKKNHGSLSKFFTKIIKKIKHYRPENSSKSIPDLLKLEKVKFAMKGGKKTKKKSRKFYGDWELISVHTRKTRKRR
jgi:hypothetical protein